MNLPLPFRVTDALLLKRLRSQDRDAFEAVVTRHYDSLYRQLWHLCGDRGRAADLTVGAGKGPATATAAG